MKQVLFIAALFAATSTQAQQVDTVANAIQVKPVLYNALVKDTVYQVTINVFDLKVGDTTHGANTFVSFYDRKMKNIGNMNVPLPALIINIWGLDDKVVEDYVLNFLYLTRRKQ